jgi:hypothetical protein
MRWDEKLHHGLFLAAHTLEVLVWAFVYLLTGAASADAGLVYFAFVNNTTLGYGDVIPVEQWQLLGPFAAMNGVLLFGWSTAVIFEVLRRTAARTSHAKPSDNLSSTPGGCSTERSGGSSR